MVVVSSGEWSAVSGKLVAEKIKLNAYDNTLLKEMGGLRGKEILDYGSGPGVFASVLAAKGASAKCFDISAQLRRECGEKLGTQNVIEKASAIPSGFFDCVVCNLVMCIVDEAEVKRIAGHIRRSLKPDGIAYIGFCNPRIYDLPESQLDFRFPTGSSYRENHEYLKVKKEGNYEIVEIHRPIEWYEKIFAEEGLKIDGIIYTPEYGVSNRQIHDFIIFKTSRAETK